MWVFGLFCYTCTHDFAHGGQAHRPQVPQRGRQEKKGQVEVILLWHGASTGEGCQTRPQHQIVFSKRLNTSFGSVQQTSRFPRHPVSKTENTCRWRSLHPSTLGHVLEPLVMMENEFRFGVQFHSEVVISFICCWLVFADSARKLSLWLMCFGLDFFLSDQWDVLPVKFLFYEHPKTKLKIWNPFLLISARLLPAWKVTKWRKSWENLELQW